MLNICIPLEWYERTRMSNEEPTLLELIKNISKIPPSDLEEKIAFETMMPHIYENTVKIYNYLRGTNINVRSQLILKTIEAEIKNVKTLQVIVSDEIDKDEFLVWIRSLQLYNKIDVGKICVITQREWAKNQWKEVYLTGKQDPDVIVISGPLHKKYLSAFYIKCNTKVIFIDAYDEIQLIKYQLNYVNQPEGLPCFWTTINELFDTNFLSDLNETASAIDINVIEYELKNIGSNNSKEKSPQNLIGNLFTDQVLMDLLSNNPEIDILSESSPKESYPEDSYIYNIKEEWVECVKVTTVEGNNKKFIYVPIDLNLKVKKFNKQEIESLSPFELKNHDIWIKVKEKKKRELFNEILSLASNTLLLKWIDKNVNEWKLMLKELWQQYYTPNTFKKNIYKKIKDDINDNGGNVESYLTIANWINGDVDLVRSYQNLEALANLLNDERFKSRVKIIYQSMRELWGIHIKLGKSLGKLIEKQASIFDKSVTMEHSQWINLGKDIVLRVDDILNTIDLIPIQFVETNTVYNVQPIITEKFIDEANNGIYTERGLITSE